jgi:hypothetical protein
MSEIRETGTRLRIGDLLVSRTYVYVILGHFKTKWDPYDTGGREIPLELCLATGFCERTGGADLPRWARTTTYETLVDGDRVWR